MRACHLPTKLSYVAEFPEKLQCEIVTFTAVSKYAAPPLPPITKLFANVTRATRAEVVPVWYMAPA